MFRGTVRTIHFVGIGGIGMSGIAEVLLNLGFAVTGSDLREGDAVRRLRDLGAQVAIGHADANIGDADVVVRSTAVSEANPEIMAAHERRVPVIRRAEMLAELMRLKHGIAVAGSHGKTTTTSMLASILAAGGLDPTVVIGGRLDSLGGSNARLGAGEYLVAEADESDGSFTLLSPTVAMITNIDAEHLEHYGTFDALQDAFLAFANKVPFYGFDVLCVDDPIVQGLLPHMTRRVVTYGLSRAAEYHASRVRHDGLKTTFVVSHGDQELGEISMAMPGEHNVANAVGAVAAARELRIPFAAIQSALDGFSGVQRRFTVVGEAGGVTVIDDYGHHPVEIRATLGAAEDAFPGRRIFAVFQPHRYSRVAALWDDFAGAFGHADRVVVCPIYEAGETPLPSIDHGRLAAEMRERGHRGIEPVAELDHALDALLAQVGDGDVVITLGAGNVNRLCKALLDRLSEAV